MVGNVEPSKSLKPVKGNITEIPKLAENLAEEVVSATRSTSGTTEAVLRIEGTSLHVSRPLRVAVVVVETNPAGPRQVGRTTRELGNTDTLDLQSIFTDRQFTGPDGISIDMELAPAAGTFLRQPVTIFKLPDGFSLAADARLRAEDSDLYIPHD